MLLCLTKWHNTTVHFHHTDLLQEVPGMNYKTSEFPQSPIKSRLAFFNNVLTPYY